MRGLALLLLISTPIAGQLKSTGSAKTYGPCSPAISGNNNRVYYIKSCRGINNEKVEQPVFHEKVKNVYIHWGQNGITTVTSTEIIRKSKSPGYCPAKFGNFCPLRLLMKGNSLLFSFRVGSPDGQNSIEINKNNAFVVNMPGCDWNYSANALEIVNANKAPIFQFIKEGPSRIVINGFFLFQNELLILGRHGFSFEPIGHVPRGFGLRPIFKYPAWKFPGKYAEKPK